LLISQRESSAINFHSKHQHASNVVSQTTNIMGSGGVGICSVPCNWRVAGSNLPQTTA